MSAPPHLSAQIEKARALVAERQAWAKESYSTEGWSPGAIILPVMAFHARCALLREAEADLRKLEAQVATEVA
jgi:hypothetical protein